MRTLILTICFSLFINVTYAQLQNWIDFETSDEVNFISTTKVSENMIPYYFEGLQKTWLPSMKYQKEKGYIETRKLPDEKAHQERQTYSKGRKSCTQKAICICMHTVS